MMSTKLFYFNLFGKKRFCQNILGSKNFEQKLRHQMMEAEALKVKAEAIQKLPLLQSCEKLKQTSIFNCAKPQTPHMPCCKFEDQSKTRIIRRLRTGKICCLFTD